MGGIITCRSEREADRLATCRHEVGHCVAAFRFGCIPAAARANKTGNAEGTALVENRRNPTANMLTLLAGDVVERWWKWGSFDARQELGYVGADLGTKSYSRWWADYSLTFDLAKVCHILHENKRLLMVGLGTDTPRRESGYAFIKRLVGICRQELTPWLGCVEELAGLLFKRGSLGTKDILSVIRDFRPKSTPFAFDVSEREALHTAADAWLDDGIVARLAD